MEINNTVHQHSLTSKPQGQTRDTSSNNVSPVNDKDPSSKDSYLVEISPEGIEAASKTSDSKAQPQSSQDEEFTQEEVAQLAELKARDVEVRAHEQAHLSAAGGHATGGASFSYQKGPDGQSYAVGGEVGIDLSKESDPNATVQKMQTIKRAALAPASPSSTDRQVAAQAEVKEAQARQEILQEQQEKLLKAEEGPSPATDTQINENVANTISPSISTLKASISAYEQMAAM